MKIEQTTIATYGSMITGIGLLVFGIKDIAYLFAGTVLFFAGLALVGLKIWHDSAIKEIDKEYLNNKTSKKESRT